MNRIDWITGMMLDTRYWMLDSFPTCLRTGRNVSRIENPASRIFKIILSILLSRLKKETR